MAQTYNQYHQPASEEGHNTTLTGAEIQQHLGLGQNQPYSREPPREMPQNQAQPWLNRGSQPPNQYYNNYMTGAGAPTQGGQGYNW